VPIGRCKHTLVVIGSDYIGRCKQTLIVIGTDYIGRCKQTLVVIGTDYICRCKQTLVVIGNNTTEILLNVALNNNNSSHFVKNKNKALCFLFIVD
jgi:hypothetical protein